MTIPHARILARESSALLLIDLQEAYRGKLEREESLLRANQNLLRAAVRLALPVIVTEQYPKGLGRTWSELVQHLSPTAMHFEKTTFSCLGAAGLPEHLKALGRRQIVVGGIETHVCVSQTVHDLLATGYMACVVRDAVSSRHALDDEVGFQKMLGSGAVPTTVEQVLLEWLRDSRASEFKEIQQLIR